MSRRLGLCAALLVAAVSCQPLAYKAEADAAEAAEAKEAKELGPVILYGYDDKAPRSAPDGCIEKGRIEASSLGETSFPADKLRAEARDRGANGVTRIKTNGKEDGFLGVTKHFRALAVLCKPSSSPPGAAPTASAR